MPNPRDHTDPMLHACVGVMCEKHEQCARYAYIDGTQESSADWLGTCAPSGGPVYSGFIAFGFIGPPAPHHWRLTRFDLKRSDQEFRHPFSDTKS